ncbi:MAG: DUF1343 domain-containing protein [Myxococcales bacterium]|nr:DUF1343 domain-containing protein [Myxococcales bacterium]
MLTSRVQLGLDVLVAEGFARLKGRRVGLLCHAASCGSDLRHITQACRDAGVNVVRCFGPEHGIWADAQDMIAVDDNTAREPVTGAPVRSLYGADEDSLAPRIEDLADLDVLVIDLQDVGARYYTYIYTAALAARVAAKAGVPVMVLDRPNPLGGERVEGGLTGADHLSFVGLWPLPVRHGLTIGEVVTLLNAREGFGAQIEVVEMRGWRRAMYHEATGVPWVQPSPNMPTVETAVVYPGMCLIEGTTMSEGRGTTRPFELIGADFVDPFALAEEMTATPVAGIVFRPTYFRPTFHKFGGRSIGGVALHVTDRDAFDPLRAALHFLAAVRRLHGARLEWRTAVYEFVGDRLAIDLLFGGPAARALIEAQASTAEVDALWAAWQKEAAAFTEARRPFLRYA